MNVHSGSLYVVATPIGNLGDFGPRGVEILSSVDYILAEDTRVSGRLLSAFGISTRLRSFHDHNEKRLSPSVIDDIRGGARVALISDAGTPLLSDPGFTLVRSMQEAQLPVRVIPGPSALTAALSVAGLAACPLWFEGFLPPKPAARRRRLLVLEKIPATLAFYEAPHRVRETLKAMCEVLGDARMAVYARELSKRYEQTRMGTLAELSFEFQQREPRGEFVILIQAAEVAGPADEELRRVMGLLLKELPTRKAASLAAAITGARRNDAYQLALAIKRQDSPA